MYKILRADILDVQSLYELEKENFPLYEQYSLSQLQECLTSTNYIIYKLVSNETIISYIILLKVVDEYEILKICTLSCLKKQGFASKLLKTIIEKENINKIFLEVRESNISAQKLYLSNGFKVIGKRAKYYGNEDAIIME